MKTTTTITLDIEVKEKATKIINEKLGTSLSGEVENYLKMLIKSHEENE